ncbi:MAG: hypothetical protein LN411_01795 [Candidatus Thermoplasmatota archaeon]|nr:hypothetical protein [Candidatus Thermoplasmatota archaeon]
MIGKYVVLALACLVAVTALGGIDNASAGGQDHNHLTHGEDEGYYEENNNNPFDGEPFPGDAVRKRAGVQW